MFCEYAVKIRYDTYDSEEETFVWVILGRIDGEWYLVQMNLSRLMSELEQKNTRDP